LTLKGKAAWPVCVVVLAGLFLSLATLARRPDQYLTSGYLFGDQSVNLLMADELLSGKLLYRDIFSQYGPIPAYLYAGFAGAFGNSPTTFLVFHLVVCLITLALLTRLVGRVVSPATTIFVMLGGVLPVFLTPGALLGSYTSSPYIPLERLCLVVLALLWTSPQNRSLVTAAALGLTLGVWQGLKFGGALYAGLALFLVDVLALALSRPTSLRPWVARTLLTGVTFLGVEALWASLAFWLLPWRAAVDALWPQYMLVQYASLNGSPFPVWDGWKYFLGQQLTPFVGIVLGVAALVWCLIAAVRRRPAGEDRAAAVDRLRLLIPLLFFLLGFAGYFRHAHLPLQYVWAGCLAGALLVDRLPRSAWLILGLCWLPGLGLVLKSDLVSFPDPKLKAVKMPNGDALYLTAEENALLDGTLAELARIRSEEASPWSVSPRCVLFYPGGAGMHHFYPIPRAGRHVWYLAGFLRPYEDSDFLRTLDYEYAVVYIQGAPIVGNPDDPGEFLNACFRRPVFDSRLCDVLRSRLHNPVRVSPCCLVFSVRPPEPGEVAGK
jgi:hypothetical protein